MRFGFKMNFRRISYIAQHHRFSCDVNSSDIRNTLIFRDSVLGELINLSMISNIRLWTISLYLIHTNNSKTCRNRMIITCHVTYLPTYLSIRLYGKRFCLIVKKYYRFEFNFDISINPGTLWQIFIKQILVTWQCRLIWMMHFFS